MEPPNLAIIFSFWLMLNVSQWHLRHGAYWCSLWQLL